MHGVLVTMAVLQIILKSVALNSNHLIKPVNSGSGTQKGHSRDDCLCPHGVPPQEGCEGQSLELFEGSIIPVSEG